MRKDDFDEEWEADAHVSFSSAAENEFTRLKHSLKVKAGLIKPPLTTRIKKQLWGLMGFFLGTFQRLVQSLRRPR